MTHRFLFFRCHLHDIVYLIHFSMKTSSELGSTPASKSLL